MTRLDPIFIDSPEHIAAERQKVETSLAHMKLVRSETAGLIKGYEGELYLRLESLMAECATEQRKLRQDGDLADGHIHNAYAIFQAGLDRLRSAQQALMSLDNDIQDAVQELADEQLWMPWTPAAGTRVQ